MKFKVNDYRANKPYLEYALKTYSTRDPLEVCSMVAAESMCPLLALLHYLQEIQGTSDRLSAKIDKVKRFYLIDTIIL